MLVKPNSVRFGYDHKVGATAYLIDPAGNYSLAGGSAPTIDSAGAVSDPAEIARKAAAGTHVTVSRAIAGAAKIVEGADADSLDGLASVSDLAIDGSSASGDSGVGAQTLTAAGTYIPVRASTFGATEVGNPVRAHSLARPDASTTGPAGAYSGVRAPILAAAGTYITAE